MRCWWPDRQLDFLWSGFARNPPSDVWEFETRGWLARRSLGEGGRVKGLVAAAVAFAVTFMPQAATYLILNGHLGPHASVARKMNWMAPHALQVLFSPAHGFFVWTPLALVALAGLFTSVWKERAQVAACLPALHGRAPDLHRRQRGIVDGRRRVRPAPVHRPDGRDGDRARGAAAGADAPGAPRADDRDDRSRSTGTWR